MAGSPLLSQLRVRQNPSFASIHHLLTVPSNPDLPSVTFTVPRNLPSGQYLVRMEAIALHVAQSFGGAQFYISCGQVEVTGGGSGTPGPLVSIPGVYTGQVSNRAARFCKGWETEGMS